MVSDAGGGVSVGAVSGRLQPASAKSDRSAAIIRYLLFMWSCPHCRYKVIRRAAVDARAAVGMVQGVCHALRAWHEVLIRVMPGLVMRCVRGVESGN